MKMTVLRIDQRKSSFGGNFWYVFMKSDTGQSFRTCIYEKYGNYRRCGWDRVITQGIGAVLDFGAISVNRKGLWDADIAFRMLPKEAVDAVK